MRIIAKTIKGVVKELNVESTTTVEQLKRLITEAMDITGCTLSLVHKTKILKQDSSTLQDFGVNDGDTITVVTRKVR